MSRLLWQAHLETFKAILASERPTPDQIDLNRINSCSSVDVLIEDALTGQTGSW